MSNDRLRFAISKAKLTPEQLADLTGVDLKTAQRWLAGRTPYAKHRLKIAEALQLEESEIWPEVAGPDTAQERSHELQGAWPAFTAPDAPSWKKLIAAATERIELCDYALTGLLQTPGAVALLQAKAAAGINVRVMVASLESLWLTLEDHSPETRRDLAGEGPLLKAIRLAHQQLWRLSNNTQVQARQALMPRCPAILRFDEDMLIAIPLWDERRQAAPVLHLYRRQQGGLFDRFTAHFDALWETGFTIDPNAAEAGLHRPARSDPYQGQGGEPAIEPSTIDAPRRPTFTPYGRRQPHRRPG